MHTVFLQLGSNIGNRKNYLIEAIKSIEEVMGSIVTLSKIYESTPWRADGQGNYLNQVLHEALQIEKKMGRVRLEKWGQRIIDIDILFYNDEIIETVELCIPHKHIHERLFVLKPLAEIASDFIHPKYKLSIQELFNNCPDLEKVEQYAL